MRPSKTILCDPHPSSQEEQQVKPQTPRPRRRKRFYERMTETNATLTGWQVTPQVREGLTGPLG